MPKAVPLSKPATTIGRDPRNDVVLPHDSEVSQWHAEVRREGTALVLYDRDSRNGTFVNNLRVTRHTLNEGDQVRIGKTVLHFQGGRLWAPDEAVIRPAEADLTLLLPLALGIAGLLLLVMGRVIPPASTSRQPRVQAVVAVSGTASTSGSGTIVDSHGLILTANSILGGDPAPLVGLITGPEVPPDTWFQARVIVTDTDLDLAMLLITNQVSGEPVHRPLNLRPLAVGDSDELVEGERLKVMGYPAVPLPFSPSGFVEIVQVQDAVVESFQILPDGTRQWVELDRDIGNLGFRGGAVLDEHNKLVGIPLPELADPRQVRPINLAQGLIRRTRVLLGW
jgi:S1-C subfamily serine protease